MLYKITFRLYCVRYIRNIKKILCLDGGFIPKLTYYVCANIPNPKELEIEKYSCYQAICIKKSIFNATSPMASESCELTGISPKILSRCLLCRRRIYLLLAVLAVTITLGERKPKKQIPQ